MRRRLAKAAGLTASGIAATVAVAACGSSGHQALRHDPTAETHGTALYGTLPAAGTPSEGGTITIGQLTGATPTYIFPIPPATNTSGPVLNLVSNLFLPLYNIAYGTRPKIDYDLSIGEPPRFSDHGREVTIPLRHGMRWADGAPVDAQDVLFDIALLKAAVKESVANWAGYTPGLFPSDVVSATAPDRYTVVLKLSRASNPGYFLNDQLQLTDTGVYPLPSTSWDVDARGGAHLTDWSKPAVAKRIYDYLSQAGGKISSFASNPLWQDVDGPFKLKDFNVTNGSYDLAPNRAYGLAPKARAAEISYETFTSGSAEETALRSGTLDIDPNFDTTQLALAPALKRAGITVFGSPTFAWAGGIINFKDRTDDFDKVIAQLYVRQAIAHLVDQPAIIKGIDKNAAVPAYGPVPSQPLSPYSPANASVNPYPYEPSAAVSLLRTHGWKVVPGGQTTCVRPGSGATQCGAGIPAGTPLKFTWAAQTAAQEPSGVLTSEAIASAAKHYAGIDIDVQTKTADFLYTNYNDTNPAAKSYTNDWGVVNSGVNDLYFPTQEGTVNAGGPYNVGAYDDPQANRLMSASTSSERPSAVTTELSYITRHLPVFYLPDQDFAVAVSNRVGGPAGSWLTLSQVWQLPQFWYRRR